MKNVMLATAAVAAMGLMAGDALAQARDQIRVVGSSTVFPFSSLAAEQFGRIGEFPAPVVESTGTGGGMRLFCGGVGVDYPDITGASRAMKASEWENCQANGVDDVTEIQLGFDGITLAVSLDGQPMDVTRAQLFQALAAEVEVDGEIVANPHERWSDIDADLPDVEITVLGPPPTSGTRDAWIELVMEEGCDTFPAIADLAESDEDRHAEVCQRMREDGHFVEAGENDNLIVQRLVSEPDNYGIFGYSFLAENADSIQPAAIDGVEPSEETIADFSYPVSRPIFVYAKNAHRSAIPGLEEFIAELTDDRAFGPDGYMTDIGLIAMPEERRAEVREAAESGATFSPSE
ncbi:substrate-binding domain-containing protein [Aquibaculum arenosum]|uniref:Substrate-binding domain-containing protein n=1 Tax=Aquibaculum arenosum TaxID=3032591 RepID=A0ABT5YLP8_9PROT|nr:substrate-binding domain-containing protein [Fodinicurvata sp. CAU 1616]MDF2095695.1 substrate-binding domain-containing protein [Fodinicurvata sp. CAU 1616]